MYRKLLSKSEDFHTFYEELKDVIKLLKKEFVRNLLFPNFIGLFCQCL